MAAGNLVYVGKSRLRRKYKRKKYSPENNTRRKSGKRYQQVPPLVPQEVPKEVPLSVVSRDYHLLKDPDIDDCHWTRLQHGDGSCLETHGTFHRCRYCVSESASTSSGYSSDSEELLPRVNFDDIELRPKVSFISNMSFGFGKLTDEKTSCLDKLLDPTAESMQIEERAREHDEDSTEIHDVEMEECNPAPESELCEIADTSWSADRAADIADTEETKPFVSRKHRKKSPRDFLCCAIM